MKQNQQRKEKELKEAGLGLVGSLIVLVSSLYLLLSAQGCVVTAGTPSGIREYSRGLNGLVVTGKSKPNALDEYFKTERHTESEKTSRYRFSFVGEEE